MTTSTSDNADWKAHLDSFLVRAEAAAKAEVAKMTPGDFAKGLAAFKLDEQAVNLAFAAISAARAYTEAPEVRAFAQKRLAAAYRHAEEALVEAVTAFIFKNPSALEPAQP